MIDRAVTILRAGGCLIYPTETFYALGCSGTRHQGRRAGLLHKVQTPVQTASLIIGDPEQLGPIASCITPLLSRLMEHFWPGPLSILVPARSHLPRGLVNDRGLLCVRLTSHPGARSLCLGAEAPLTASSANLSGKKPPSSADEIDPDLKRQSDFCFNPLPLPGGGAPSTIVAEPEPGKLNILRAGAIDRETLIRAGFFIEEQD